MTAYFNYFNSKVLEAFRATPSADWDTDSDHALRFLRGVFSGWEWSSVGGCEDWHDQKHTVHRFGYDDPGLPYFGEWCLSVAFDGAEQIRWWAQTEINGEERAGWYDTLAEALLAIIDVVGPAREANEKMRQMAEVAE
jgi:hypothetical protein